MNGITAVGFFLVAVFFGLVILALWLRIALRFFRFSALHPFAHMVYKLTDFLVSPIDKILGLRKWMNPRYDVAAVIILILVEFLKMICLSLLGYRSILSFYYLFIHVVADLIVQPLDYLFYALIIRVVLSFTNPNLRHPVTEFIHAVTEPLLKLGRRIVPNISGFDFAPFIMMIILKVIDLFITANLPFKML